MADNTTDPLKVVVLVWYSQWETSCKGRCPQSSPGWRPCEASTCPASQNVNQAVSPQDDESKHRKMLPATEKCYHIYENKCGFPCWGTYMM